MGDEATEPGARPPKRERPQPRPRPVTADWLFRAAAYYLERYASTEGNLRRVLGRKVDRRVRTHDEEPDTETRAAFAAMVDETVAKFVELKLVDDRTFAESRLRTLRRVGTSGRQAAAKLAQKGVGRDTVEAVMAADETDERAAARRYAERRQLGPYRLRDRAERRERDIAAMMRAGFPLALARAAVDGEGLEED